MFTDLTFTNRSLNRNVRAVGLFWSGPSPLYWYRITGCEFHWTHLLRINWAPQLELETLQGIRSGPFDPADAPLGVHVSTSPGYLHVGLDDPDRFSVARVCLSGRATSEHQIRQRDTLTLPIPGALNFCADPGAPVGQPITWASLNASNNPILLGEFTPATIAMKGGEPGAFSTAIRFQITETQTR